MGEPLKKEDFVRGLIVNADEYTEEKMIVLKKIEAVWVNLENLQSAVEWLKFKLDDVGIYEGQEWQRVADLIREAFSELNSQSNENKKEARK